MRERQRQESDGVGVGLMWTNVLCADLCYLIHNINGIFLGQNVSKQEMLVKKL